MIMVIQNIYKIGFIQRCYYIQNDFYQFKNVIHCTEMMQPELIELNP